MGTSPFTDSVEFAPRAGVVEVAGERYLTLSYGENGLARDLVYQVQQSSDLIGWTNVETVEVSPTTYRLMTPLPSTDIRFLRLQVAFE